MAAHSAMVAHLCCSCSPVYACAHDASTHAWLYCAVMPMLCHISGHCQWLLAMANILCQLIPPCALQSTHSAAKPPSTMIACFRRRSVHDGQPACAAHACVYDNSILHSVHLVCISRKTGTCNLAADPLSTMGSLRAELMQPPQPLGGEPDDDINDDMLILGSSPPFDKCVPALLFTSKMVFHG
eukprot:1137147-Pelagomonas_calceolata.AAC.7